MRDGLMRKFGLRLRKRIKAAGVGNINVLLRGIGISQTLVHDLQKGNARDAGIGKIAEIALILGMKPSELVTELDELLLYPPAVTGEEAAALGLADWPAKWEPTRLAVVLDVVEGWLEATGTHQPPVEIGAIVTELYDDTVRRDPGVPLVQLRRVVTARMFGIELPDEQPFPRGRGRPSTAGVG